MNFQPDFNKPQANLIKVIGVGGGGSNAVNHMFKHGIEGVDFYICNTDIQALRNSSVPHRYQLGETGLGAGSLPEIGELAAVESASQIEDLLKDGTRMVFITAGMGGGTGTGAAPVIAKIARDLGILTVGIVTMPFEDEGPKRNKQAQEGLNKLRPNVDALLTISNDRIVDMYEDLTFSEAFSEADDILCTAAKGIAEIIFKPGLINVDFMDVKTAMENSGHALMGRGVANGVDRAAEASKKALNSPLLDNTTIDGASHLLINLTYGNSQPTMRETKVITRFLQAEAGNEAHLKMGITHDDNLGDNLSVTVIATGFHGNKKTYVLNEVQTQQIVQNTEIPQAIQIETIVDNNTYINIPNHQPIETIAQQPTFNPTPIHTPTVTDIFNSNPVIDEQYNAHQSMPSNYGQQPRHEVHRHERESLLTDENVPSFITKNINLHQAPSSADVNISKFSLNADTSNDDRDFTIRPNRHLHDNVD
ncbi:MAG: cell division protein FtsZ [Crocinitomicaceae bacterium]|nr:cell division protein FtsZ [Crocinitomicaceae bacterium]